jgi:predicted aspartyl protease
MYREFIKRKFPQNDDLGLYVSPQLPATKLGKILMKETRVKQPTEVIAMYLDTGFFGGTYLILTDTKCYYDGGMFDLETLRSCSASGNVVEFTITGIGTTTAQRVKLGDANAASTIAKVLDDLAYWDKEKENETAPDPNKYHAFEGQAVDWLLLRDEVMRTIDQLYERFQDGKLSLLEFESKKTDLLARL